MNVLCHLCFISSGNCYTGSSLSLLLWSLVDWGFRFLLQTTSFSIFLTWFLTNCKVQVKYGFRHSWKLGSSDVKKLSFSPHLYYVPVFFMLASFSSNFHHSSITTPLGREFLSPNSLSKRTSHFGEGKRMLWLFNPGPHSHI